MGEEPYGILKENIMSWDSNTQSDFALQILWGLYYKLLEIYETVWNKIFSNQYIDYCDLLPLILAWVSKVRKHKKATSMLQALEMAL